MAADPLGPLLSALAEAAQRGTKLTTNRLGIVTGVPTETTIEVQFDGETIPSGKTYRRLASYEPIVGDRVLLLTVGTTYLALGAVAGVDVNPVPEEQEPQEFRLDLDDGLTVTSSAAGQTFTLPPELHERAVQDVVVLNDSVTRG